VSTKIAIHKKVSDNNNERKEERERLNEKWERDEEWLKLADIFHVWQLVVALHF
jgi:hypothetical protein